MQMTFTPEEEELVRAILDEHYRVLVRNIAKTDTRDFRLDLQAKAKLLESVLNKLRARH